MITALDFQFLLHECCLSHEQMTLPVTPELIDRLACSCSYFPFSRQGRLVIMHRTAPPSLKPLITQAIEETRNSRELNLFPSTLKERLTKIAEALFDLAPMFHDEENVLYYCARHSKRIEQLSTRPFLSSFLGDLERLRDFLVDRYQQRGFVYLLPKIHATINELKRC